MPSRFSGVAAFNFYAVTIFRDSFGSFNPHLAAVVTGTVQLVASGTSGVLSDLVGRLPLLIFSTALMSSALAGFGCYAFYILHAAEPAAGYDWVPLGCVILFVAAFSLGMNPISWLLIGEIFPLEFRHVGPPVATAFSYVCAFVGVKTFVDLRQAVGMHGTFWAYALISVLGLVFSIVFVPETKGRTLDEMQMKSGASSLIGRDPESASSSTSCSTVAASCNTSTTGTSINSEESKDDQEPKV